VSIFCACNGDDRSNAIVRIVLMLIGPGLRLDNCCLLLDDRFLLLDVVDIMRVTVFIMTLNI